MATQDELDQVEDAFDAFLATGGCKPHKGEYDPGTERVRKCCAVAFATGATVELHWPESSADLDEEDEDEEEQQEGGEGEGEP